MFKRLLLISSLWAISHSALAAPEVLVSIKPLHSLVASVMDGVGTPDLLIDDGRSPHRFNLKPSDARALANADLVIWIGDELEAFLVKPIQSLTTSKHSLALIDAVGIETLRNRTSGATHENHDHSHGHSHEHGQIDPHIWLDPLNAVAMANTISARLSAIDAKNKSRYAQNTAALTAQLNSLSTDLKRTLTPIQRKPLFVFHDSYQYLEKRFGLTFGASVLSNPAVPASVKHIRDVREQIGKRGSCVFAEPQFDERLVATVTETSSATVARLDPLGANIVPGKNLYTMMMRAMRDSLVACLNRSSVKSKAVR